MNQVPNLKAVGNKDAQAFGEAIALLLEAPLQIASTLAKALTQRSSSCEIPPPCWEPRPLGDCRLTLTPGSTGTVRVHVTNCNWSSQVVTITATGTLAGVATFQPTTLLIEPQSTATIMVSVHIPDTMKAGAAYSGALLVRGCINHFARIDVRVAECAAYNCCDLVVKDCQDHIHHWYDHFYCARPCRTPPRTTQPNDFTRGVAQ